MSRLSPCPVPQRRPQRTALPGVCAVVLLLCACGPAKRQPPGPQTNNAARQPAPPTVATVDRHFSAKGCEGCHPEHYEQWSESLHAKAHAEPVYDFYFMLASRDDKKLEPFCGRCHTPIGTLTGQIPFKHALRKAGDTRVGPVANHGVQCGFCHTITGHTKVENAGFVVKPSEVKLGPLADARPDTHRAGYSAYYRSAEYCGTCHQVTHPTNGIKLETTYSEWKASPYAKAGIVCQDCHLTDGLGQPTGGARFGKPKRHPGQAAITGKSRPHVSTHYFVGPNLMFSQGPKAKALRQRSEALLRRAAKVAVVGAKRVKDGLQVQVSVSNVGAGHSIPTGVTELRQVWLEVRVTDGRGRLLLHSGGRDKKDHIQPGAVVYRTHVYDAKGRDTTLFWRTVRKGADRRIPAGQSLRETFLVKTSAAVKAARKVTVAVDLHYRSVPPWGLAEAGVPPGTVKVPIFTMASTRRELPLR